MTSRPKALVMTGYGLNCDYETYYCLERAGAQAARIHINDLIPGENGAPNVRLEDFHIIVFDGGFSWGDDHGAGVLLACRARTHLGGQIRKFIDEGKLIMGICNGFQAVVNMGLLPGVDGDYSKRDVALITNDCANFRDDWIGLTANPQSPCIFTKGVDYLELPIRHGEGKLYASEDTLDTMERNGQIVFQYSGADGTPAKGSFPFNPNGSLRDIAGICDPTGRILGMMPHPEAYNRRTNHPQWTRQKAALRRQGKALPHDEGLGMRIFHNAVAHVREHLL